MNVDQSNTGGGVGRFLGVSIVVHLLAVAVAAGVMRWEVSDGDAERDPSLDVLELAIDRENYTAGGTLRAAVRVKDPTGGPVEGVKGDVAFTYRSYDDVRRTFQFEHFGIGVSLRDVVEARDPGLLDYVEPVESVGTSKFETDGEGRGPVEFPVDKPGFYTATARIELPGARMTARDVATVDVEKTPEVEEKEPDEPSDFEVAVVREPERPEEKKKEEEQESQKQKTPPKPQPERKRKTVEQTTNEETPEEAKFRSDQANKVDEETVARETTNKTVEPSDEQGNAADQAGKTKEKQGAPGREQPSKKQASRRDESARKEPSQPDARPPPPDEPEPKPEREADEPPEETTDGPGPERAETAPSETSEKRAKVPKRGKSDQKVPMPTVDDYDKVFDGAEDRKKAAEHREKGAGHGMYKRIEESKGSVKAALENYVTEVRTGNHTAVNAKADAAASYINQIHRKIHPLWGDQYLPRLDNRYGPDHPLSDPTLKTVLEFVIDGDSGELESVNIVTSSGQTQYDVEAIQVAKTVAPHPEAPDEIVSPDGNVYMFWRFWRNQRQCGTFGVSIYKLNPDTGQKTKR